MILLLRCIKYKGIASKLIPWTKCRSLIYRKVNYQLLFAQTLALYEERTWENTKTYR